MPVAERHGKDRPVEPGDADQSDVRHHAAQDGADRSGRYRVGVGRPEMEGDDGALDEEAAEEQRHGHDHEAAARPVGERHPDLREVEGARAGVDQRDPDGEEVPAQAVRDREVDRSLHGPQLLDLEPRQRVGGDAH